MAIHYRSNGFELNFLSILKFFLIKNNYIYFYAIKIKIRDLLFTQILIRQDNRDMSSVLPMNREDRQYGQDRRHAQGMI